MDGLEINGLFGCWTAAEAADTREIDIFTQV